MENAVIKWFQRKKHGHKEVTLEDVMPMHPYEYPAKHLKERLDARREELEDIEGSPMGLPEGPGMRA